jgi:hypothetical protein
MKFGMVEIAARSLTDPKMQLLAVGTAAGKWN